MTWNYGRKQDYAGTSVSRIAYKVTLWENGEA